MRTFRWRQYAACRGMDPELFHPSRGDNAGHEQALAVCAECPVRAACLDYALNSPRVLTLGVWGGTSERQRKRMRTARRREAS